MCTAIALRGKESFYFGRNMDIYYSLDFETARIDGKRGFEFSCGKRIEHCLSVIGTAVVRDGYPLYADAMNEAGLCMAGLEFPEAVYCDDVASDGKLSVSPYELISWVLTQCSCAIDAKKLLLETCIVNRPYSAELPLTPLHWMIADKERSYAVESTGAGLNIYDCAPNVLTNAPEYPFHAVNLRQYANLSHRQPSNEDGENSFGTPFSSGFGAIGLPGDFSSASRFVRAAFVTKNAARIIDDAQNGVAELFRALSTVAVPRGSVITADGRNNITYYTSCMDVADGKYYRIPYSLPLLFNGDVGEKI